jgi:predicted transcriptional regulator
LNYSSIKEELQISNGTLSYHLKMMEKENFIKSERDGLYKRFYTVNSKKYPSISTEEQILGILR